MLSELEIATYEITRLGIKFTAQDLLATTLFRHGLMSRERAQSSIDLAEQNYNDDMNYIVRRYADASVLD